MRKVVVPRVWFLGMIKSLSIPPLKKKSLGGPLAVGWAVPPEISILRTVSESNAPEANSAITVTVCTPPSSASEVCNPESELVST